MNRQLFLKSSVLAGGISGVLCIIYFLSLYVSGIVYSDPFYKFSFVVTFPMIFVAVFYYKKAQGGELRFWQGIVISSFTNLIALVIFVMFLTILLAIVDPGFVQESIEGAKAFLDLNKDKWLEQGMLEEDWLKTYAQADLMSPQTIALEQFFIFFIAGAFYSLVLSVLLRK